LPGHEPEVIEHRNRNESLTAGWPWIVVPDDGHGQDDFFESLRLFL